MKKKLLFLGWMLMFLVASVSFSSCSDKDGDEFMAPTGMDAGSAVSGTYAGELQVMGYTSSFRAFITLERMAPDAVNLKIRCEDLNMNMQDLIMDIYSSGAGYILESNSKAITGSIISNTLNITFSTEVSSTGGSITYTFFGSK